MLYLRESCWSFVGKSPLQVLWMLSFHIMGWDIVFRRVSTKLEIHWNKPLITSYTKLAHEESKNRCFFKQKTRKQHIFNTSSKCYCCVSLNFPCLRWVIPTDFRSNFFWHRGMDWMGRWWKTLLFIWWCAYQDLLAVETSSQKKTSTIHPPQCKVNTWCWRNIEFCHFLSKHLFCWTILCKKSQWSWFWIKISHVLGWVTLGWSP